MDDMTREEIDIACHNTLRDAGISKPPVKADAVLEHLELYRDFYNLQDPTFFDRTKHKIQVNGRKLVQIIKKFASMPCFFLTRGGLSLIPACRRSSRNGRRFTKWDIEY